MRPTPYIELNQVLFDFQSRIKDILGDNFIGFYLQGSFAVGDFDEHSDVDFIVVIEDDLSANQLDRLQVMHDQVYQLDSEWAKHLEGSYFPREVLRKLSKRGIEIWYLDHGARSLVRSDHCNTLLVRWILREKGVVLTGPEPKTLLKPISTDLLRGEIYETITTWGEQILQDPSAYNNHFYQSFILLSYCRMLNDLVNGYPGSKREGADWAKKVLDPAWSDLIDRAWDGRPDPAGKIQQPADPQDFERTLKFVRLIMAESRSVMTRL